jgi:hypothetical protein
VAVFPGRLTGWKPVPPQVQFRPHGSQSCLVPAAAKAVIELVSLDRLAAGDRSCANFAINGPLRKVIVLILFWQELFSL